MSINDEQRKLDPTAEQWAIFIREWWAYCYNMPIRVNHLYTRVASACPGFEFNHIDTKQGRLVRFGSLMAIKRNAAVAGFRLLPGPYRTTSYILTPTDEARVLDHGRRFVDQMTDAGMETLLAAAQALVADGRLSRAEITTETAASQSKTAHVFLLDGKPLPIFDPPLVPVDPASWMNTPELRNELDRREAWRNGEIEIDGVRLCACGCGERVLHPNRYRWKRGHMWSFQGDLLAFADNGDPMARAELIKRGWFTPAELTERKRLLFTDQQGWRRQHLRRRLDRAEARKQRYIQRGMAEDTELTLALLKRKR